MGNFRNKLDNYQAIPRELIFDNTMSDRARFVFCYMASKPNNWDFYLEPMAKEIGYSSDTLRKYINELIANGWLIKGEQQRDKGSFGAVEYTLLDSKEVPNFTDSEKVRHGENEVQIYIDNNNIKEINDKETKDNKLSLSKKVAKNEWRKDFDVYKAEVEKGRDLLLADEQYKKQMTDMYPNIDFYRTIIKVFNFWITDKGWEYKKKSKSTNIDMAITFKRNIDKNIVYQNRANMPIENKTMLELKMVDSENGTLEDGTIFKDGYRYYFSMKDKRTYSIPIKAPKMPNDYSEWDYKKNVWYYPRDNKQETINDMLW